MTRAEFESKLDAFFGKYDNKYMDYDGVYGNQFEIVQML